MSKTVKLTESEEAIMLLGCSKQMAETFDMQIVTLDNGSKHLRTDNNAWVQSGEVNKYVPAQNMYIKMDEETEVKYYDDYGDGQDMLVIERGSNTFYFHEYGGTGHHIS